MTVDVALLQQKAQFIRRYLIKLGASPQDAEDIAQESIYKLFLYVDSIDAEKVSSWLFRVARNHYYDLCRKQNKEIIIKTDKLTLVDGEPLPEDHYHSYEQRIEINMVLNKLKPIYKNLLLLKYELELTYEEISELLDMKPGTLKTYLYRARENFKFLYEREVIVNEKKK